VGRLQHNKGFDVLAGALQRASAAGGPLAAIPWRWVIVGTGPFRPVLERVVDRHGIGSRTMFAGAVSDVELHAWYEAASVFVHPTRYEGSSIVTLEAMAHRKPVIATRAGGLPDKIRPGRNGWLVEPDDVAALTGALAEAVSARPRLADMGALSREIVEQEFSWAILTDRYLALYRELLGRAGFISR
jgi:glycosyltransferase involved in cell wall biosynthesis